MKKIVLAYSGGLDTSIILRWLQENYKAEVIAYTSDIGQVLDKKKIIKNAKRLGVKKIIIENLKNIFVKDYVFPMIRAHAVYEGVYLLGTSIARPLIAKRQVEIAKKFKAFAVSHGATGKGNDQVRFELGAYALHPNVKIIAPWREWDLNSRAKLLRYAKKYGIPIENTRKRQSPYSMDANLLHISYEGGILEDPSKAPPEKNLWKWTNSLENTPNKPQKIVLSFEKGDLVSINGQRKKPHELLHSLNLLGSKHGVGRLDLVENRFVGLKSRGCYETPAGTIYAKAHRAMESITLDRELLHLKEDLANRYSRLIYNGYWFSPERESLQTIIDDSQKSVSGLVKLKLHKGNVIVCGRQSPNSLYSEDLSTFEKDSGSYDQKDAEGFIKVNALRLKNKS